MKTKSRKVYRDNQGEIVPVTRLMIAPTGGEITLDTIGKWQDAEKLWEATIGGPESQNRVLVGVMPKTASEGRFRLRKGIQFNAVNMDTMDFDEKGLKYGLL